MSRGVEPLHGCLSVASIGPISFALFALQLTGGRGKSRPTYRTQILEKPDNSNDRLVDTTYAAAYLGVSNAALEKWRQRGIGPAYVFICPYGKTRTLVRYRLSDLKSCQSQIRIEFKRLPLAKMDRTRRPRGGAVRAAGGAEAKIAAGRSTPRQSGR
jgi:hypothetical protein